MPTTIPRAGFVEQMCAKLNEVASPPDAVRYSQFFEIFCEAMVLRHLRKRVPTRRVQEEETETPDFACELDDGLSFYVELKALDVVGGKFRHNAVMADAKDTQVELRRARCIRQLLPALRRFLFG